MIEIRIREIVSQETRRALSTKNVKKAITMGLKEIGKGLVATAQKGIKNSPKTYRVYYYKGIGWTKSSKPNTYPADQSGGLRRSIKAKINGYKMVFGAQKDYGKYLQQTDSPEKRSTWVKIAPRPFLTLSHNQNKGSFGDIMEDNYKKMMG